MWGGPALGTSTYAVCSQPITRGIEFELDFGPARRLFMHGPCFFAWDGERRDAGGAGRPERAP